MLKHFTLVTQPIPISKKSRTTARNCVHLGEPRDSLVDQYSHCPTSLKGCDFFFIYIDAFTIWHSFKHCCLLRTVTSGRNVHEFLV